jgi:hypothetical protein
MRWPLMGRRMESNSQPADAYPTGPERLAVDSLFRSDAAMRLALTENLKPLRAESEAIAARVENAFDNFDLNSTSRQEGARPQDGVRPQEGAGRNYVEHGTDISETRDRVIREGVDALRSSDTARAITFSDRAVLESLSTDGSSSVELEKAIEHINQKGSGSSLLKTPTYAQCQAEIRANEIVTEIETAHEAQAVTVNGNESATTREADELVKGSVNLQMNSATSPEERLAYGSMPKIPNTADKDATQKVIRDTFELRPGASDVPSYHDFHTLQIAFQHVWTRIFDGELETLGRQLYREYVKLKDFGGFTEADLQVRTSEDLQRLIDEVRKLSQWVEDDIPTDFRGSGGDGRGSKSADDWRQTIDVATGGLTWLLRQALEEFSKIGRKPIITWEQFPGPWVPRQDKIDVEKVDGVAPKDNVEIALRTDDGSDIKIIELQLFDEGTQRYIPGQRLDNRYGWYLSMVVPTAWMSTSVIQFASEGLNQTDIPGRYVLAELSRKISDRSRVTFYWKDS